MDSFVPLAFLNNPCPQKAGPYITVLSACKMDMFHICTACLKKQCFCTLFVWRMYLSQATGGWAHSGANGKGTNKHPNLTDFD